MAVKKTTTVAASKKPAAHPTFLSMIQDKSQLTHSLLQECITNNKEDVRKGVSRPAIKKYLAETFKLDMSSAANINNLNSAIKRGAEKGELILPSGTAGKVKNAPKQKKASDDKENVAPTTKKAAPAKKATTVTKSASKPAVKAAAPAGKKPAAKKASTTTKAAPKAAPKAASTTKAAPKKTVAKKAEKPAAKKTSAPKKAPAAKAAAGAKKTSAPKKAPAAKAAAAPKKAKKVATKA
ncbi:histone H1/5 [Cryptococcus wingfieldii CBS 7118]|uniref:Histone H1 n=1 Tax=Cryptococcus wingfieldii CBS 7118 TaxID=1295528 RepID=A0A1E3K4T2_9TREE|nr:histone H1/5 [Cryptococcus wingfieldii CBS 7118]ODO07517.1 histone H1/5 [Cryptococcus wingfieldii CBS 7118]